MNNMAFYNYIIGALGAAIGGAIMQASAQFPMKFTENGPGAGFWPFSLGFAMLLAAVVLVIHTALNREELTAEAVNLKKPGNIRVYMLMGVIVLFCVLINLLGFYPAALLLVVAIMRLMDYQNNKIIALTAILAVAFIYLVFGVLLHTTMPQSIFLE